MNKVSEPTAKLTAQEKRDATKRKKRDRALRHVKELLEASGYFHLIRGRENSDQRLSSFFKRFKESDKQTFTTDVRNLILDAAKTAEPDQSFDDIDISLENHEIFDLLATSALSLGSDSVVDEPILAAFRAANLDPKNPLDWRLLMTAFCWSHYPPKGASGRPSWTDEQYGQLLADSARVRAATSHRISDRQLREAFIETPQLNLTAS